MDTDTPGGSDRDAWVRLSPNPAPGHGLVEFHVPLSAATSGTIDDRSIEAGSPTERRVTIELYDASGRLVRRLFQGGARGSQSVVWNGCDDAGRPVAAGTYFLRLVRGDMRRTSPVVLLR
jgi:hypothetical protein